MASPRRRERSVWLLALACLVVMACERRLTPPQFRHDDYEAARAEASRRQLPLFVDVWASWCHTCMSMKEFVLRDPLLGELGDQFVWLSIDSERSQNAAFLARFESRSLPTLWVIEPRTQRPLLKWIGAATAPELASLLRDARRDFGREPGEAATGPAELAALRLRADRATAGHEAARAIELYREVLNKAGPQWPERARTLEALSMRLHESKRVAECVELAAREAARMPKTTALVNVLVNAIDAASDLAPDAPEREALPALIALSRARVGDRELRVLADDRSGLYLALVDVLQKSDPTAARSVATEWATQLEREAAAAKTSAARRVFDPHRLEAYLALQQPERAVPMLQQSEREDPADYNPPARLARAQLALGQTQLARGAVDRALVRCEGPRKLRLYLLKADVQLADKDRDGARATLREALTFASREALSARYQAVQAQIERRLQELS